MPKFVLNSKYWQKVKVTDFLLSPHPKNLYIDYMKDDPIIADVRKAREDISKRFGGDMAKIYAYFKEEEQKLGRKVRFFPNQKKSPTPSKL
jgi:hypothetical protein